MAYIMPDSSITFCSLDIPLTSDYQNTIKFNNQQAQLNYFSSKATRVLENYSVIKKEEGALKVEGSYNEWLNVNYCYFTNSNFGSKLFFAFVEGIEYLAPNTTRIRINIDLIQTYFLFNCDFKDCLIERTHVAEDILENCLMDEGLELGDYEIINETYRDFDNELGDRFIVAAFSPTQELKDQLADGDLVLESPGYYGGQFVPFYWGVWTETSQPAIERLIDAIVGAGQGESIIGMWYFFQNLIPEKAEEGIGTPIIKEVDIEKPFYWDNLVGNSLNGFIPKNNKLYTFPYCYLQLNGYGQIQDLKYEYTGDTMKLYCPFTPGAQMFIWPDVYNKLANNLDCGVASKGLPLYGYSVNSAFNNYMTQQAERSANLKNKQIQQGFDYIDTSLGSVSRTMSPSNTLNQIEAAGYAKYGAGFGAGAYSAAGLLGGAKALGVGYNILKINLTSDYAKTKRSLEGVANDALRRPTETHNQNSIPELNYILGFNSPFFVGYTLKNQKLKVIDNFFTMYGYKVNKLEKPNISSRKSFNYIKLGTANINGDINEEDLIGIKNIFENGITFWHTTDVGNYDLDNSIVGGV